VSIFGLVVVCVVQFPKVRSVALSSKRDHRKMRNEIKERSQQKKMKCFPYIVRVSEV
jgi:hypothetical protein